MSRLLNSCAYVCTRVHACVYLRGASATEIGLESLIWRIFIDLEDTMLVRKPEYEPKNGAVARKEKLICGFFAGTGYWIPAALPIISCS